MEDEKYTKDGEWMDVITEDIDLAMSNIQLWRNDSHFGDINDEHGNLTYEVWSDQDEQGIVEGHCKLIVTLRDFHYGYSVGFKWEVVVGGDSFTAREETNCTLRIEDVGNPSLFYADEWGRVRRASEVIRKLFFKVRDKCVSASQKYEAKMRLANSFL